MPINTKGGKNCKKKKKGAGSAEPEFIERAEGQMPARAIRLLGNRNVLCYSNDGILRLCHICGKMKGRVYIEPGDIVLITLRDFSSGGSTKDVSLGDIVGKYSPEQHSYLKREQGISDKLFMKMEVGGTMTQVGKDYSKEGSLFMADDGFDFENSDDEEEDEGDEEGNVIRDKRDKRGHRDGLPARTTVEPEGELNVDDL